MSFDPSTDIAAAHRHFAADCFNRTWDFVEKATRTPDEDEQMIGLAHASLWHWTQREDCTAQNLSVGYWQLSRVYALAGMTEQARRYGELCLRVSHDQAPFYLGYAHEALARAAMLAGDEEAAQIHLTAARRQLEAVLDDEERKLLQNDLDTIG
jgi:hypothetical protein